VKNAQRWLADCIFPLDEVAMRLHHGIVPVHPFPPPCVPTPVFQPSPSSRAGGGEFETITAWGLSDEH